MFRSRFCAARFTFTRFRFARFSLALLDFPVLYDHRYAPVRGVVRYLQFAWFPIREAPHLIDMIGGNSIAVHYPARRIGAIDRQFPVAVIGPGPEWLRVGVAFHHDVVG